jgi:DeoR/GlpR family transcriptional regulator of sugar metabolism
MAPQFKQARLDRILAAVRETGQAAVSELSHSCGVSAVTIRRDLRELAEQGLLRRAHGGALLPAAAIPEPPVIQRMAAGHLWKEAIGRATAALVANGESVFIGSGSTTAYVARHLTDHQDVTVVTNALNVAAELAPARGVTVVVTGGMLRPSELSLIGHITEQALREVRVDKVVIGMRAISLDAGLTNDYLPEVVTDRTILGMAPTLILVADHTKFGQVASAYVAPLEQVTTLVTDSGIAPQTLAGLRRLGVQVVVAEPQ